MTHQQHPTWRSLTLCGLSNIYHKTSWASPMVTCPKCLALTRSREILKAPDIEVKE